MKFIASALLLFAAVPLSADALGDVRGAISRFSGRDPVRATYEIEQTIDSAGRFDNEKSNGRARVELEGDASGVRIVFSRALLDHLERERQARLHSAKPAPTGEALSNIHGASTSDAIDFAPHLLRLIEGAKLVTDAAGTWQGKPARVLVLRAADRVEGDQKERLKIAENRVTLWLASDLVPVAVEHLVSSKFSFLFLKAEWKEKKSWHLARSGDRLVRSRYEEHVSASGMGQKMNQSLIATVQLH